MRVDFLLIIPCYNEARNLGELFSAARACFESVDYAYEFVFVNDGRADIASEVLRKIVKTSHAEGRLLTLRVIVFSRNFGKEAALFAGLEHATVHTFQLEVVGFHARRIPRQVRRARPVVKRRNAARCGRPVG